METLPNLTPYRPLRLLAKGTTGIIYLARKGDAGPELAVKVFRGAVSGKTDVVARSRALAAIAHDNLVKLHETGCLDDGCPFVAMELLRGRTLDELLAHRRPLSSATVVHIASGVCRGLQAMHEKGLLHLDVRPSKVLLHAMDQIKLLGSGAVGGASEDLRAKYWSPEQRGGQDLDVRADIYSLGAVIREALVGRLPPGQQRPVPPGLDAIVDRCLRPDRNERYATVAELAAALAQAPVESPRPDEVLPETMWGATSSATSGPAGLPAGEVEVGQTLGSYRLLELLGVGGMGKVFLGEHNRLGRKVAIKVLRAELAANAEAVRRFFDEARAVNDINHENIVEITDFIERQGSQSYYIMELLKGQTLSALVKNQRLPLPRALRIAVQICRALGAVHARKIIHRDLKPENIFLTARSGQVDFVKVLDFGVAKMSSCEGQERPEQTRPGTVLGTPEYMSPEQVGSEAIDHRTDIYSFGVILYRLVAGRLPLEGRSLGEYVVKHMSVTPTRPGSVCDIPKSLDELIMACLEKEPALRPPSMDEIVRRLERELVELDASFEAFAPTLWPANGKGAPRRRSGWLIAAAGVGLLGGGLFFGLRLARQRPATPATPVVAPRTPEMVEVVVESSPSGVEVLRRGVVQGKTPLRLTVERAARPAQLQLRLEGFESVLQEVSLGRSSRVHVELKPARRPETPVKKASGRGPDGRQIEKPGHRPHVKPDPTPVPAKVKKGGSSETLDPFGEDK